MARSYKRDSRGRFSSTGGGGKLGKSAKNDKARAKYKEASGSARAAIKQANAAKRTGSANEQKFWNKQAAGAKSGLTRVTQNLRGGAKGNLGAKAAAKVAKPAKASKPAAKAAAKAPKTRKSASKPMANQVASGRTAQKAYKAASSNARFERRVSASGGGNKAKLNSANKKLATLEANRGSAKKAGRKASRRK